jgi:hypothetical protein
MTYEREHKAPTRKPFPLVPTTIAVVAIIAAAVWYLQKDSGSPPPSANAQAPVTTQPAAPVFPKAVEEAPDIPQAEETYDMEEEPAESLPPLANSDEFARNVLAPLSAEEEFALWLQTENLLQKAVAFIDGLSKGNLLKKVIPVQPPKGKFNVIREEDRIWLDETNYERYDGLTALFTGISPETLGQVFHTLRPLLESAYGDLGYPADKFDNSFIAAIDQILAAPEIDSAIALKSESVAYQFADPALESLPAIQKQMLRMGPENTARIKAHLRQVRQVLLAESTTKNMEEDLQAD